VLIAALETGSVTDWIQAVLAVLGAAAAGVAWLTRQKNRGLVREKNRLEQDKIELETTKLRLEREKAALELQAAESAALQRVAGQARQISIRRGTEGYPLVRNGSDAPIFEVSVTMFGLDHPTNEGRYSVGRSVLRAGEEVQISLSESFGTPDGYDLRFRDAAGVYWQHDEYGQLVMGVRPRVSALPHAPREA
jgi:hypothetical protein